MSHFDGRGSVTFDRKSVEAIKSVVDWVISGAGSDLEIPLAVGELVKAIARNGDNSDAHWCAPRMETIREAYKGNYYDWRLND